MESPFKTGAARGSLPPPSYVTYIPQGEIRYAARLNEPPAFKKGSSASEAQKAGIRFQAKVRDWAFGGVFIGRIEEGPWFAYEDESRRFHFCQPDFIFDDTLGVMTVVEAKRIFSSDAWWQLRKLYLPVLQKLFPNTTLIPLCVCKSFDPATACPEVVNIVLDLFDCKPAAFNVLVLP